MGTILCLIDGMTDEGFDSLHFPCLNSLNIVGEMDTTPEGKDTESLSCILKILGVRDIPDFLRGYIEALGCCIEVSKDDLVLRGSWQSLENGRVNGPFEAPYAMELGEGIEYHYIDTYKSILVLKGYASLAGKFECFPPYKTLGKAADEFRPTGFPLLEDIFDKCKDADRFLIPWAEARFAEVSPFPLKTAMISGCSITKGIGRFLGMDVIVPEGATGDTDTDLTAKCEAAIKAADEYPLVVLHINGSDEASHRRDAKEKQDFILKVDELVLKRLCLPPHRLFVMGDHGTSPLSGEHIGGVQKIYSNRKELVDGKQQYFFC